MQYVTKEQFKLLDEYIDVLEMHDILQFSTTKFCSYSLPRKYNDKELQEKLRQLVLIKLSEIKKELKANKIDIDDYILGKYEKKPF